MSTPSALFSDLLTSITERGRSLIGLKSAVGDGMPQAASLIERCEAVLSGRGEASGTALATEVILRYGALDAVDRLTFFKALLHRFGPDQDKLARIAKAWLAEKSDAVAADLHFTSEPRRQELLRRLNRAPGGTRALVAMRADLVATVKTDKDLAAVDRDFAHLLASWFNRGFLVLRRIDWSTPAIVLEKIIRYEAVHEISDFPSLRLRIDPPDRRCYGFFHPALIDEPLIFVEVALTDAMPGAIGPLLDGERKAVSPDKAKTAVFYSISNCQKGLAGISFGNFLIKQVVEDLRREFPKLETFVTLSPVPGFSRWLKSANLAHLSVEDRQLVAKLEHKTWIDEPGLPERMKRVIEPLALTYFLAAKRDDGRPVDPVANFHLGNGARLERINWLGDISAKGLRDGAGLMVNYLYNLDDIEKNHEAFANNAEIVVSNALKKLVKADARGRPAEAVGR
ncbi:malonyl-CoA decarboxylase [Beijerinckia sp. L45]|uniref:malonyl-CoA decarboxylase n=1 Tax=Beijerinckia sp. L45 TaxID=1641855 RepID=UPI00131AF646|nr:malonyl-CoA decarboxylase [Beijerinckia sp. L45]